MLRFLNPSRSASSLYAAVAALLLCLMAPAPPAHADHVFPVFVDTDSTINSVINADVIAVGSATVNLVDGGTIGRSLGATETSTLNVSGGTIGVNLVAFDTSKINLSGGTVGGVIGLEDPGTRLNVFGSGLRLSPPQTDQIGQFVLLTGTLADGTPISKPVYLLSGAQVSQITLHNTDPFLDLREDVEALGAAGVLNAGNTNALLVKLDAAQAALARGSDEAARGSLGAFINQVNAFVRTGKLTAAQGTALTAAAQAILDSLD
jgi:hypothetical protein